MYFTGYSVGASTTACTVYKVNNVGGTLGVATTTFQGTTPPVAVGMDENVDAWILGVDNGVATYQVFDQAMNPLFSKSFSGTPLAIGWDKKGHMLIPFNGPTFCGYAVAPINGQSPTLTTVGAFQASKAKVFDSGDMAFMGSATVNNVPTAHLIVLKKDGTVIAQRSIQGSSSLFGNHYSYADVQEASDGSIYYLLNANDFTVNGNVATYKVCKADPNSFTQDQWATPANGSATALCVTDTMLFTLNSYSGSTRVSGFSPSDGTAGANLVIPATLIASMGTNPVVAYYNAASKAVVVSGLYSDGSGIIWSQDYPASSAAYLNALLGDASNATVEGMVYTNGYTELYLMHFVEGVALKTFTTGSSLNGGNNGVVTITLTAPDPVSHTISLGGTNATIENSFDFGTAAFATIIYKTKGVDVPTTASLAALDPKGSYREIKFTLNRAPLYKLTLSTSTVVPNHSVTGYVQLNGNAGPSGRTVSLSSDNVAATVPATMTIPAQGRINSFVVATHPVSSPTTVHLQASDNGTVVSTTLTVNPAVLQSVHLTVSTIVAGNGTSGAVTLTGINPASTAVLLSSDSTAVTVPQSVSVPANAVTGGFTVQTHGVDASTTATLTAQQGGITKTATLQVTPALLNSVTLQTPSVVGGISTYGVVHLNGQAGPSGVTVNLSSSSTAATVNSTMSIGGFAAAAIFGITTHGVAASTPVTLTATLNNVSKTATLTVNAAALQAFSPASVTVKGGTTTNLTLKLTGQAPSAGATATLASTNSNVAQTGASAHFGAFATQVVVPVTSKPVASNTAVTISATLNGVTVQAVVTVTP
jgi:hypothetical protein